MTKEQFGATTAIYNKLFYNVRGQLPEIREAQLTLVPATPDGARCDHQSLQR